MQTYRVMSDNFAAPRGATITDEDLVGCNVDALVDGGHLAPAPSEEPSDPAKAGPKKET